MLILESQVWYSIPLLVLKHKAGIQYIFKLYFKHSCASLTCCMFCCMLLYVHSSFPIILMEKRELVALLGLSSWCRCDCCVALPHGAMGLSAVCICGIS